MQHTITYKESKYGFSLDGIEATYKGVFAVIATGDTWVSIYSIESSNPGKGEAQEFIDILRKDYPDKELCASIPMNNVIKHIFDKKKVKYDSSDL